jgi:TPP-dependent 2-oxoacid decarboxylase
VAPSDISYIEISTPDEPLQLTTSLSDPERVQACANAMLSRLSAAHSQAFLLDLDADCFGILGEIRRWAEKFQLPVAVPNISIIRRRTLGMPNWLDYPSRAKIAW